MSRPPGLPTPAGAARADKAKGQQRAKNGDKVVHRGRVEAEGADLLLEDADDVVKPHDVDRREEEEVDVLPLAGVLAERRLCGLAAGGGGGLLHLRKGG